MPRWGTAFHTPSIFDAPPCLDDRSLRIAEKLASLHACISRPRRRLGSQSHAAEPLLRAKEHNLHNTGVRLAASVFRAID